MNKFEKNKNGREEKLTTREAIHMYHNFSEKEKEFLDWYFENELEKALAYLASESTASLKEVAKDVPPYSPARRLVEYELMRRRRLAITLRNKKRK